ncbi:MAG: acyl-CoA thioesterase [Burkholderiales bacterium]|jgi:acyl-coenzyme A thioesterase PaaI-like protein
MQTFSTIVSRPARADGDRAAFVADVTPDWLQGRVAFGGIQGAFAALAMRAAVGPELPLRALQMTFVASVDPGEARAEAVVLRRGRAITHVQCTLHSGGRPAAVVVGMYGASRESKAIADMPMPDALRMPAELREAPYLPERMPGFLQHYRQRWAGGAIPYSGSPMKPASMWARLRESTDGDDPGPGSAPLPAPLDAPEAREANVVALCDLPPSPVMATLSKRAPGASLTWLLELLADPRTVDPRTWLMLHTETRHAAAGYTSQTARVWDDARRPVAVSHQTTAIFD